MAISDAVDVVDLKLLSEQNYNATVEGVSRIHSDLIVLRVRPDEPVRDVKAGQYALLGLGSWAPAIDLGRSNAPPEEPSLIKRAYSISCALVDETGQLVRVNDRGILEFYIALVRQVDGRPSKLTPRLFALQTGDRLYCDRRVRGRYTLDGIEAHTNVLFVATGTGEAPHNAMLAELLARGHRGRIASAVCVRYERDLAYRAAHCAVESKFANYRYLPLTTREPVNVDPNVNGFIGKRYLQDYLSSGDLERDAGWAISPADTHIFLCGNPQMIGANRQDSDQAPGMLQILRERGFALNEKGVAGNVHYERYW